MINLNESKSIQRVLSYHLFGYQPFQLHRNDKLRLGVWALKVGHLSEATNLPSYIGMVSLG